ASSTLLLHSSTLFPYTTLFRSLTASYTINNFVATGVSVDTMQLDKSVLGAQTQNDWLTTHVVVSGSDVLITDGNNTITVKNANRSEEHTSELQSPYDIVCRLLL